MHPPLAVSDAPGFHVQVRREWGCVWGEGGGRDEGKESPESLGRRRVGEKRLPGWREDSLN